jgi:hypothetical protein
LLQIEKIIEQDSSITATTKPLVVQHDHTDVFKAPAASTTDHHHANQQETPTNVKGGDDSYLPVKDVATALDSMDIGVNCSDIDRLTEQLRRELLQLRKQLPHMRLQLAQQRIKYSTMLCRQAIVYKYV